MLNINSGLEGLEQLTSMANTKTSKFWQSTKFMIRPNVQDYFVAPGSDIRLYSPGRFVLMCDGVPNVEVAMTVNVRYHVHLSEPAIQNPVQSIPQLTCISSYAFVPTGSSTILSRNEATDGTTTIIATKNGWAGLPLPENVTSPIIYQFEFPMTVQRTATDPGRRFARFCNLTYDATAGDFVIHVITTPQTQIHLSDHDNEGQPWFWQGDRMTPVTANEFLGTVTTKGFWVASPRPYVKGRSMISKEFQQLQQIESSQPQKESEHQLMKLVGSLRL